MNELTENEIAFIIYSLKGSASVSGWQKPFVENIIAKINLDGKITDWTEIVEQRELERVSTLRSK